MYNMYMYMSVCMCKAVLFCSIEPLQLAISYMSCRGATDCRLIASSGKASAEFG